MKVIVTTITRSPKGNPMRSTRELNAEQIRLGRGAECELRLADPRVPIHARTILPGKSGPQLYEVADPNTEVTAVYQAPLTLLPGTTLKIGPFQIDIVDAGNDADLALTMELVQALPESSKVAGKEIFNRATRAPVSRRVIAWLLFLPILVWFLVFPALNFFFNSPDDTTRSSLGESRMLYNAKKAVAFAGDSAWNPGELAAGHKPFANNCKACHSESFTRVKDADCKACHQSMGDHVSKKVGHVAALDETRCASCHQDHKGALALQQQNTHYFMGECGACHADIKSSMATTSTQNVSDFARQHPEFRVALAGSPEKNDVPHIRLPKTGVLTEQTTLKFPHDVHLNARGVKSPTGLVKTDCASCHTVDATGIGFKPVTMKANCQSCHELRFELAAPEKQLPHGNVNEVMTTLREFYSYVAVNGIVLNRPQSSSDAALRGIPGKTPAGAERLGNSRDVDAQVNNAAREIFERTTCFTCHEVARTSAASAAAVPPAWSISPIPPAPVRMPAAKFSHDKHALASCSSCHAATSSRSAQDVLMPKIDSCRGCHAGSKPEPQKIVSNCGLCHGFHLNDHSGLQDSTPTAALWPSSRDAALLHSRSLAPPTSSAAARK